MDFRPADSPAPDCLQALLTFLRIPNSILDCPSSRIPGITSAWDRDVFDGLKIAFYGPPTHSLICVPCGRLVRLNAFQTDLRQADDPAEHFRLFAENLTQTQHWRRWVRWLQKKVEAGRLQKSIARVNYNDNQQATQLPQGKPEAQADAFPRVEFFARTLVAVLGEAEDRTERPTSDYSWPPHGGNVPPQSNPKRQRGRTVTTPSLTLRVTFWP